MVAGIMSDLNAKRPGETDMTSPQTPNVATAGRFERHAVDRISLGNPFHGGPTAVAMLGVFHPSPKTTIVLNRLNPSDQNVCLEYQ